MVTSPNKWKFLEWGEKLQTNKHIISILYLNKNGFYYTAIKKFEFDCFLIN